MRGASLYSMAKWSLANGASNIFVRLTACRAVPTKYLPPFQKSEPSITFGKCKKSRSSVSGKNDKIVMIF